MGTIAPALFFELAHQPDIMHYEGYLGHGEQHGTGIGGSSGDLYQVSDHGVPFACQARPHFL
jgi:hypothetical protein